MGWRDSIGGLAGKPVEDLGKAVRDVMRRGVQTCRLETPVEEIAKVMAEKRAEVFIVVDVDGEAVGMITDWEVAGAYREDLAELRAERIMQPKAQVVAPDTLVIEAVHIMRDRKVRHLLIKGEQRREVPVGIISAMDIVRDMAGLTPERPEVKLPGPRGAE
jgi:CBS domain-containing protein